MFRDAIKEVRHHPGRVLATLVAIAISVGFMAAVSIFVTTQSDSLGKQAALVTSHADLSVDVTSPKQGVTAQRIVQAVKAVPGVTAAESTTGTQMSLATDDASVFVQAYVLPGEQFRWAGLRQGAWPQKPTEVAIAKSAADKLKVAPGGTVTSGDTKLTVSGITDEPSSLFFQSAYVSASAVPAQFMGNQVLAKVQPGTDAGTLKQAVRTALVPLVDDPDATTGEDKTPNLNVQTAAEAQAAAVRSITGQFNVMKYVLWVFSGIAALVGMIIIANTFTILLAQRRRQIGLLRAVGATGSQVRRRFLAEAVLLGLIGSLLGLALGAAVAAVGAHFTGALFWGLSLPWTDLLVEVLVGIVLTVLAAMLPSLKATRVKPLEALQPVATSEQLKRASRVRTIVCGLFFLLGLLLALSSLAAKVGDGASVFTGPMVRAVLGSMLVAIGVLFGAPLFIPALLRLLGRLFGLFGATPRLAASNAVRNPRRASATATALMLACGLIATLQVGTATAERTVLHDIQQKYPVDISITRYNFGSATNPDQGDPAPSPEEQAQGSTELTAPVLARLEKLPNVAHRATFTGGTVTSKDSPVQKVVGMSPEARTVTGVLPTRVDAGQALSAKGLKKGTRITLTGNGHTVTLRTVPTAAIDDESVVIVPQDALQQLVARPTPQMQWLKLANPDDIGSVMGELQKVSRANPGVVPSGSVAFSYMVRQVLMWLLRVITGLLGAAVLIALIGVSNTLGLSVIERTRESALLRALGMQRGSLRLMLLVEALMLALTGVLVGVAMGSFFGWLGVKAVLKQAGLSAPVQFGLDWPKTLGLIGLAVVAAAIASILPGRRAASATPTQALAEA